MVLFRARANSIQLSAFFGDNWEIRNAELILPHHPPLLNSACSVLELSSTGLLLALGGRITEEEVWDESGRGAKPLPAPALTNSYVRKLCFLMFCSHLFSYFTAFWSFWIQVSPSMARCFWVIMTSFNLWEISFDGTDWCSVSHTLLLLPTWLSLMYFWDRQFCWGRSESAFCSMQQVVQRLRKRGVKERKKEIKKDRERRKRSERKKANERKDTLLYLTQKLVCLKDLVELRCTMCFYGRHKTALHQPYHITTVANSRSLYLGLLA